MPGATNALANDPSRCHLFNLGDKVAGGGPFAVTQNAYDPEDPAMAEAVFVLLRNGAWIDQLALAKLPADRRFDILFATSAEAVGAMQNLSGKPEIERYALTQADMRERVTMWKSGGFEQNVIQLVESYRDSLRR